MAHSFYNVTEQPGQSASAIQIQMLEARYSWAAQHAGGKDVLEVACGTGIGLPLLAKAARSVQAGDLDAENLLPARAACAGNRNVGLRVLDAQKLPFAGESFDLVLLFEAIYYLPDFQAFLQEAHRVLRKGSTLLIVTANPEWSGFNPSPFKTRYWRAADLLKALDEQNFAARVEGAFPEEEGWLARTRKFIRCAAVALKLIPRTMRGKVMLKRLFYGRMKPLPALLAGSGNSPRLEELCGNADDSRYRVLYATARKVIA